MGNFQPKRCYFPFNGPARRLGMLLAPIIDCRIAHAQAAGDFKYAHAVFTEPFDDFQFCDNSRSIIGTGVAAALFRYWA